VKSKTKPRRGRVAGRAIIKGRDSSASWDQDYEGAAYGQLMPQIVWAIRDCRERQRALRTLEKQLEAEAERLTWNRIKLSLQKWLTLLRRKPVKTPFSYDCAAEILEGAQLDPKPDKEVYRYFQMTHRYEQESLNRHTGLDGYIWRAIVTGNAAVVRQIATAIEELPTKGATVMDQQRLLFLLLVGKDATGKIRPASRLNKNRLATAMNCDRRTVERFLSEYGVTCAIGKPGRPPSAR
jgi:hypothetical protein